MVVLMEYSPGLAMKRKGGEETDLLSCSGEGDLASGVAISCRATKIRRLESPGGYYMPALKAGDVMMGEAEAPSLPPGATDEERALVVFDPADAGLGERIGLWRGLFPSWEPLRIAGAEWHEWIRDMIREADIRTVREVLSSAQLGEGYDLAVVPWCAAAPAPASMDQQASTAADEEEEDVQGTAAMEVEEEAGLQTSTPGAAAASSCREERLYRWPQHCRATPPPLPAVPEASSVMCSW